MAGKIKEMLTGNSNDAEHQQSRTMGGGHTHGFGHQSGVGGMIANATGMGSGATGTSGMMHMGEISNVHGGSTSTGVTSGSTGMTGVTGGATSMTGGATGMTGGSTGMTGGSTGMSGMTGGSTGMMGGTTGMTGGSSSTTHTSSHSGGMTGGSSHMTGTSTGMAGGLASGMTGASTGMHGRTTELVGGSGEVIDSKTFTKTEDHEVLLEKKAIELQHRPVQKEYVVETKYVGEQRVRGGPSELVGTEERQVEERVVAAPAGDRTVIVENVDVPREMLQQTTTSTTSGMQTMSGTTGMQSMTGTTGMTGNTTTGGMSGLGGGMGGGMPGTNSSTTKF